MEEINDDTVDEPNVNVNNLDPVEEVVNTQPPVDDEPLPVELRRKTPRLLLLWMALRVKTNWLAWLVPGIDYYLYSIVAY